MDMNDTDLHNESNDLNNYNIINNIKTLTSSDNLENTNTTSATASAAATASAVATVSTPLVKKENSCLYDCFCFVPLIIKKDCNKDSNPKECCIDCYEGFCCCENPFCWSCHQFCCGEKTIKNPCFWFIQCMMMVVLFSSCCCCCNITTH